MTLAFIIGCGIVALILIVWTIVAALCVTAAEADRAAEQAWDNEQ